VFGRAETNQFDETLMQKAMGAFKRIGALEFVLQ
jgi:hypothetical protein